MTAATRNIVISLALLLPGVAVNATGQDLPSTSVLWQTTYDCPEWEFSKRSRNPHCNGLTRAFDNLCSNGRGEQITLGANYPLGRGGRGQRHWVGDGKNDNSGGTWLRFGRQPELWMRWYMRYEPGFRFQRLPYDKLLYFYDTANTPSVVVRFHLDDTIGVCALGGNPEVIDSANGHGWRTVVANGGKTSDGKWDCYEVHLKAADDNNGVVDIWVNGERVVSRSGVRFDTTAGWSSVMIGHNQWSPGNGRGAYMDYDDIAISDRAYIGPIAGAQPREDRGGKAPASPSGRFRERERR